jgi:uncharacterized repeat protein (TIGR01451 family)
MNLMKNIFNLVLTGAILSVVLVAPKTVLADTNCQQIYGGGQTCVQVGKVLLNKTVKNPNTNNFVDSLNINDPKYSPNQEISFNIWVKNESNNTVNVTVKDILPQFLTFVSGPGSFDNNTRTLTYDVNDLKVNETRTFTVKAKVVSSDQIPTPNGSICIVNQAELISSDGQTAQDNAQFCIQTKVAGATTKGGLPVMPVPVITTTPPTGPEMLPLFALIPTGIAGFILRRKVNK